MLNMLPKRAKSWCTTRRSCWPMGTSGSPSWPPPSELMLPTDEAHAFWHNTRRIGAFTGVDGLNPLDVHRDIHQPISPFTQSGIW